MGTAPRTTSRMAVLLTVAALAIGACSSSATQTPATSAPTAAATAAPATAALATAEATASCPTLTGLLAKWQEKGEILVGTTVAPPVSFQDESGNLTGAAGEIFLQFLKDMCITAKVTVVPTQFPQLIPSLQADRNDIIVDAIFIKPEREEVVDFTDPFMWDPEALIVQKGNPKAIKGLSDLCGLAVGANEGSTMQEYVQQASDTSCAGNPINIKPYADFKDEYLDVTSGRLDAAVADGVEVAYSLKTNPALGYEIVDPYTPVNKAATKSGFLIKQDSGPDMLAAFNKSLQAMRDNGMLEQIFTKWGLVPTSVYMNPD